MLNIYNAVISYFGIIMLLIVLYKIGRIEKKLFIIKNTVIMDFSKLTASLQANTDAENSAATLLTTLATEIKALQTGDPATQAQIDAFADQLSAGAASLASAVVANTPADPNAPADTTATAQ